MIAIENFKPPSKYPNDGTSYDQNMTDTPRWLSSITISLLQSVIIWQTLTIWIFCLLIVINYENGRGSYLQFGE